ncbi:hypothetical protein PLICRDRAFT_38082 [Plicaturopsis crispa FD-325 SS-3]|nr:hypothetical protein PLICRDRAFT_38082 [Plicaturopsis crispa FD-325 SS-3]
MSTGNNRQKIVVCRDLGKEIMSKLGDRPDVELVTWPENRACSKEWLFDNIPGAAGLLVMMSDKVTPELIEKAGPSLRVVSTMSVGYEHVNRPALAERGIKLGYTPDVLTDAVADLSILLALMASRNVGEALSTVTNSQWPTLGWSPFGFCGPQLSTLSRTHTRTVGFLGFGRIAQATLARLVPFGITHCLYTGNPASAPNTALESSLLDAHKQLHSVKRVDPAQLARESDVLFVLAPGGPETYHIVNEEFLRAMKSTAVLVNTARGTLVDSDALAKALKERWIWAAGLDVVEGEPNVPADHPLVTEPRCIVLPHIGSATLETRLGMGTLAVNNLLAGLGLEPGEMPAQLDLNPKS